MKFVLEIDCDNAAFADDNNYFAMENEVSRILRKLAGDVDSFISRETFHLRDVNGNKVGTARFTDED